MNYLPPVNKLLSYGDCRDFKKWPNYLKLGFTREHVPELIKMATDNELNLSDSESVEVWAPTHAWRVLGQLKSKKAIEPLMTLFEIREDDDWADSELPIVFAMIGPAALPILSSYLSNPSFQVSPLVTAASCIAEIGLKHRDVRQQCITILTFQLENYERNNSELNSFLIWYLIDLKAVDSIEVIKQAFQRGCVDRSFIGDLSSVEYELGLTDKPPQVQLFAEETTDDFRE